MPPMQCHFLRPVTDYFVPQKLQRRIANARGIAPSVSLSSSAKPGTDELKQDGLRRGSPRAEGGSETGGVTKRKYRRHPKVSQSYLVCLDFV